MTRDVRRGDCLEIVRALPGGSVDLVYVDPPFFTQKTHTLLARDRKTRFEFCDLWKSRSDYLAFLRARVQECHRALAHTGSLFFHCDSHAAHHVRCLLDEVFGESQFRSEIIWHYRRWSSSQRSPLPSHQTIFFYSKSDDYFYAQLYDDYSPSTNVDQILQRRQRDRHGKAVYARDEQGQVIHDGHKRGVPIADVWDIPFLNPKAKERVGYPTQKPVLLLERIIQLACPSDGLVLDPFCGSGTTLVAAHLLGRKYLGIDIAHAAVQLARRRLLRPQKTSSELMRKGRQTYQQSDEDALAYLHGLPIVPVQRNRGIDAIVVARPGAQPILIRVQRKGEPAHHAAQLLYKTGRKKQPATLVLIVTEPQQAMRRQELPAEIVVIPSTVSNLIERLGLSG
jgi:site-specific DNA-methyltransferase (adenine-specific)